MAEIVITEFMDDQVAADLARVRDVLYEPDLVDRRADLLSAAATARALIVRNRTRVDAELLDHAKGLRVVGRLGVGLERIDLAACEARGVEVYPARGANAIAVAEHVIASLFILFRGAFFASDQVIAGAWPRRHLIGREVCGRLLGLVGFGDIARHVAVRARGLGMRLLAYDPYVDPEDPAWRELDVERAELDRLLDVSDAVSLHVPLTPETRHLIDAGALSRMKADAVLVNTTRGGTVDEAAVVEALRAGRLGGAALDVFEDEPLDAATGARFADVPNLLLTPHIAGVTREANRWISVLTVTNVLRVLDASDQDTGVAS